MTEQQAALLTLSVGTDQLSRIFLPTDSETSALLLAARLNAAQPGGAFAACSRSESCVELLCVKGDVGKIYKALVSQQKTLGIKLQGVKAHVRLDHAPSAELREGLTAAIRNRLRLAGWTPFVGGRLMSCEYTAVAAGHTCQAELVDCGIELLGPGSAMLVITHHRAAVLLASIETVRFRPFSFIDALPESWVPPNGCDTLEACALDSVCQNTVTKTLTTAEGTAGICCLLPDFRPAQVCGIAPLSPEWSASAHAQAVIRSTNGHRPFTCGYHLLIRSSDDPDEVPHSAPSWCVWTSTGLTAMPPGQTTPLSIVLGTLVDAVTDDKHTCWGGRPLFSRQPCTQAAAEDQLAAPRLPLDLCSLTHAWGTAADQIRGAAAAGRSGAASMANLQPCSLQAAAGLSAAIRFQLQAGQRSGELGATGDGMELALRRATLGAVAASSHTAPPVGPLVQPRLAKRAVYSTAQQKHPQPPKPSRATASAAACHANVTAAVVSSGCHSGTTVTAQSNAAQSQTRLPAKPSLAKRKHAAAQPAAAAGSAVMPPSSSGAEQNATQSMAAPQLVPQASTAARPSLAHRKPAAAKPPTAKRRVGVSKTPALGTIAEVGVSPSVPSASAAPVAPVNLTPAAAPGQSLGSSYDAASAVGPDASSQPLTSAKPPARQRTKAADLDAAAVHAKVTQKHADGKLAELTVPEAKCWLKGRKLPLKGKKEDLMARIAEALLQP